MEDAIMHPQSPEKAEIIYTFCMILNRFFLPNLSVLLLFYW